MAEQRPDRTPKRTPRPGAPGVPNPNAKLPFSRGIIGWVAFIGLAILLIYVLKFNGPSRQRIMESDFERHLADVQSVEIDGDEITGTFRSDQQIGQLGPVKNFSVSFAPGYLTQYDFHQHILSKNNNVSLKVEGGSNYFMQFLIPVIPWLVLLLFLWFVIFRQLRNGGGAGGMLGNFGRSKHRITSKEHTNVTFDDVAGVEEAKEEVMEIVEFLKNPKKFQTARRPHSARRVARGRTRHR